MLICDRKTVGQFALEGEENEKADKKSNLHIINGCHGSVDFASAVDIRRRRDAN